MTRFSHSRLRCNRHQTVTAFMAVIGVLACAASALAVPQGDVVLPPGADPQGYSLSDMAVETAAYNVSGGTGTLPDVPFEVLMADTMVQPGTTLYLPIFFADNAPPLAVSPFPKDLCDQEEDADYLLDVASVDTSTDTEAFIVRVDGKTTILCDDYVVGVKTSLLPDGGNRYIVCAAFLRR